MSADCERSKIKESWILKKGRNLRSVNTDGGVNLQFKLLSAIGIIIIVSRHYYHGWMELAYNWFPPYSYNLALFVFISGYFYKTDYEENVGKYIWKRTKRLLIPAYLWNIFYGGVVAFLGLFGFTIGAKPDLYNLFLCRLLTVRLFNITSVHGLCTRCFWFV